MPRDDLDRRLLSELQRDSQRPLALIAEAVGLSTSACHRRVRQLEDAGLIEGYGARLNGRALGMSIEFFVSATLTAQEEGALSAFEAAVSRVEEVLECHLMAGGTDYLIRVVASDVADFERIHRDKLARLPHIARLQSNLVIRTVRRWSGYPVR